MHWEKLLSKKRFEAQTKSHETDESVRGEFQRDYDRIVFSSAFRRLQNKTQVMPMPESDFVHTRLTHSLEASCVGRSLGRIVGKSIVERHPELTQQKNISDTDFGDAVAAACLAHDIGNPPFGHSGTTDTSLLTWNRSARCVYGAIASAAQAREEIEQARQRL